MSDSFKRKAFIEQLNQLRLDNKTQIGSFLEFKNACTLLLILLDVCYRDMDVLTALKVLIFSNTFFIEQFDEGNSEMHKEFLQGGVGVHPIWHDIIFWEKAVYECIQSELREQKKSFEM